MDARSADMTNMRRLLRETAPTAFEKCIEDGSVRNWRSHVQIDIFNSAMAMVQLTSMKLVVRHHNLPSSQTLKSLSARLQHKQILFMKLATYNGQVWLGFRVKLYLSRSKFHCTSIWCVPRAMR